MHASSTAMSVTGPQKPVTICASPQSQPPWHCGLRISSIAFAHGTFEIWNGRS